MSDDAARVVPTWAPAPGWHAIDFVSDLHLAPDLPRTVQAFTHYLQGTQADCVVLLGDVFEVWVGDDSRTLPFEAALVDRLADAARTRAFYFMPGNRDFLVGADLLAATGMRALPDPCCLDAQAGRWLLAHGDAQCLADAPYQAFRAEVRSAAWQQAFLAQALPQRIELARAMRTQSQRVQRTGMMPLTDLDGDACRALLRSCGAHEMIHGHTHRPAVHDLGHGMRRHVLSDWDLDDLQRPRAEVLRLHPDGRLQRLTPQAACGA